MWLDVYVPRFPWLRWLEGAVGCSSPLTLHSTWRACGKGRGGGRRRDRSNFSALGFTVGKLQGVVCMNLTHGFGAHDCSIYVW